MASDAQNKSEESATYRGSCHCGAHIFHITLSPPFPEHKINQCNCSICTKLGYALVYPFRPNLSFERGGLEEMKSYQFGQKRHFHRFCGDCGASVLIDLSPKVFESRGIQPKFAVSVSNMCPDRCQHCCDTCCWQRFFAGMNAYASIGPITEGYRFQSKHISRQAYRMDVLFGV
jgi:hypothetical protein